MVDGFLDKWDTIFVPLKIFWLDDRLPLDDGKEVCSFGRFFFNRIQYSWLPSSSICLLDRLIAGRNIFFKALYIFFMVFLFLCKPCTKKILKYGIDVHFFCKSSKILTLFDVLASSGNDFDLDDRLFEGMRYRTQSLDMHFWWLYE